MSRTRLEDEFSSHHLEQRASATKGLPGQQAYHIDQTAVEFQRKLRKYGIYGQISGEIESSSVQCNE